MAIVVYQKRTAVARLAFRVTRAEACGAGLLTLLSILFAGCANSCISGFWNPPNGTIGVVISNPPPTCKLATPKGAIRIVVQVSGSCVSCSESNRVHTVVLNLNGIDLHASVNAAGESSGWQAVLPEPSKQPIQVEFLSEKMNILSSESTDGIPIPAASYDLARLRLGRNQTRVDDEPLPGNGCGEAGPNCVVMEDGQLVRLVFESDVLEFHLTAGAAVNGLPLVMPNSDNELLIELKPMLSTARPFGEATPSFVIVPGKAQLEPRSQESGT